MNYNLGYVDYISKVYYYQVSGNELLFFLGLSSNSMYMYMLYIGPNEPKYSLEWDFFWDSYGQNSFRSPFLKENPWAT